MNLFDEIDRNNAALLEATGITPAQEHHDPVKQAMEQRRQAEAFAQDYFAANPNCHGLQVGGYHFTRRF